MSRARDLIDRFGREEGDFLRAEFIAPVTGGGAVRARIAGIACELKVKDPRPGLHVLKPTSPREASIVREASAAESKRYLGLFPKARVVATVAHGATWLGLPAAPPAKGIRIKGLVPIALGRGLRRFDTAVVRFDGALFLHERTERPAEAKRLRDAFEARSAPASAGLVPAERAAFGKAVEAREEEEKSHDERRLERALKAAGAELVGYDDRRGAFTVRYRVDGRSFESVVDARDLTVVSAGICLSDQDRDFDLTSLVGVMREWVRNEE
ncbi:MAG TPA: hypothetical protein VF950_21480 [Planctomycetota bacterium]